MRRKMRTAALAFLLALSVCSTTKFTGSRAHASAPLSQADILTLAIPNNLAATTPGTVTVPVHFWQNGAGVTSTVFSLDYDPTCLGLDAPGGHPAPGVVTFNIGPQFNGAASVDIGDRDGELDIVVGDYSLPLSTLPDRDNFIQVTFDVLCVPAPGETIETLVTFGDRPPPSFSNTLGYPITGAVLDGSVTIERAQPGQTATPTPNPDNAVPIAEHDTGFTRMDEAVVIDVLANDIDPDGDPLTIVEVTQGGFGQVTIGAGSSVTYTPALGRRGEDIFTYVVEDGQGGSASATVSVTVGDPNEAPVAVNDNASTTENTSVLIDVLANDYDVDPLSEDAQLSLPVLGQPRFGTTVLNQDGIVTYIPDNGYVGEDTFLYAVADEEGASAVATVVVTVEPSDGPHGSTTVALDLADFTVKTDSSGNVVEWTTRSEGDLLTYQIHRTAGVQVHESIMDLPYAGQWTEVSPLIDGQGRAGGIYTFVDETALPGVSYAYMLAALGQDNHLRFFGPQMVVTAPSDMQYIVRLLYIAKGSTSAVPSDSLP